MLECLMFTVTVTVSVRGLDLELVFVVACYLLDTYSTVNFKV